MRVARRRVAAGEMRYAGAVDGRIRLQSFARRTEATLGPDLPAGSEATLPPSSPSLGTDATLAPPSTKSAILVAGYRRDARTAEHEVAILVAGYRRDARAAEHEAATLVAGQRRDARAAEHEVAALVAGHRCDARAAEHKIAALVAGHRCDARRAERKPSRSSLGTDATLEAPDEPRRVAEASAKTPVTTPRPPSVFDPTLPAAEDHDTPGGPGLPPDHRELPLVDPIHYAIVGEHARGGLGRVLRARDRRLGRPVAIKELLVGDRRRARALRARGADHRAAAASVDRAGPRGRALADGRAVLRDEAGVGPLARPT